MNKLLDISATDEMSMTSLVFFLLLKSGKC